MTEQLPCWFCTGDPGQTYGYVASPHYLIWFCTPCYEFLNGLSSEVPEEEDVPTQAHDPSTRLPLSQTDVPQENSPSHVSTSDLERRIHQEER